MLAKSHVKPLGNINKVLLLIMLNPCVTEIAASAPPHAQLSGGEGSVFIKDHNAFSMPMRNMPLISKLDFSVGNSFFRNPWVTAPATTTARDGLGPLFNANACQSCHINDGRGHAPINSNDKMATILVRLSIPSKNTGIPKLGVEPEPSYGDQLQDRAIMGIKPEAKLKISYQYKYVNTSDGELIQLRKPVLQISELAYGQLHLDTQLSLRIAPPMIGLGLINAIAPEDVLTNEDEFDKNNDGISGRANRVWHRSKQQWVLGRFGWKAGQPDIEQQNVSAFINDLGITSHIFSNENCSSVQVQCAEKSSGGTPEVIDNILSPINLYVSSLAVPARRNINKKSVVRGEKLFYQAKCSACHKAHYKTGESSFSWLSNQHIFPYSDFLLHDMGEELADHRGEFSANGREWRTPPLWGIGLTNTVNEKASYLHDGRARTLIEAVAWHGGEASQSREYFMRMNKKNRLALMDFLESL